MNLPRFVAQPYTFQKENQSGKCIALYQSYKGIRQGKYNLISVLTQMKNITGNYGIWVVPFPLFNKLSFLIKKKKKKLEMMDKRIY